MMAEFQHPCIVDFGSLSYLDINNTESLLMLLLRPALFLLWQASAGKNTSVLTPLCTCSCRFDHQVAATPQRLKPTGTVLPSTVAVSDDSLHTLQYYFAENYAKKYKFSSVCFGVRHQPKHRQKEEDDMPVHTCKYV